MRWSATRTRAAPTHRRRSCSAPLPCRPLLVDQISGRATQPHRGGRLDLVEQLICGRSGYLALEEVLDVPRQSLAPALGSLDELAVQSVGHVPDLDHRRHAMSMSRVRRMVNARAATRNHSIVCAAGPCRPGDRAGPARCRARPRTAGPAHPHVRQRDRLANPGARVDKRHLPRIAARTDRYEPPDPRVGRVGLEPARSGRYRSGAADMRLRPAIRPRLRPVTVQGCGYGASDRAGSPVTVRGCGYAPDPGDGRHCPSTGAREPARRRSAEDQLSTRGWSPVDGAVPVTQRSA